MTASASAAPKSTIRSGDRQATLFDHGGQSTAQRVKVLVRRKVRGADRHSYVVPLVFTPPNPRLMCRPHSAFAGSRFSRLRGGLLVSRGCSSSTRSLFRRWCLELRIDDRFAGPSSIRPTRTLGLLEGRLLCGFLTSLVGRHSRFGCGGLGGRRLGSFYPRDSLLVVERAGRAIYRTAPGSFEPVPREPGAPRAD